MQPLHINFKPSYTLTALLVMMSAAMCAILIPLSLSWQIKFAIVVVVIICLSYTLAAKCLLILPWSCVALSINIKNELVVTRRNGTQLLNLVIGADTVVTPYLTVIRYQQKNAPLMQRVFKSSQIVLNDSTDTDSFRKLRVWLRWAANQTP
jgi:hypothetical protein